MSIPIEFLVPVAGISTLLSFIILLISLQETQLLCKKLLLASLITMISSIIMMYNHYCNGEKKVLFEYPVKVSGHVASVYNPWEKRNTVLHINCNGNEKVQYYQLNWLCFRSYDYQIIFPEDENND